MNIKETINNYFEYVNSEKFDQLAGLFCKDAEFSSPVNFGVRGREKTKAFYLKVPENYPEHHDQPVEILIEGNKAAVLIQFAGKTASGQKVDFMAMDFFTFEGGKIKTLNIFYDSLGLIRMLKKEPKE